MNPDIKEKLYNELNVLLDMIDNKIAKEYLIDLINKIYYNQL
jgi:uncharacterized protein (DUF2164 family)